MSEMPGSAFNAQKKAEKVEEYIEKFNSVKGMVYQVLRENPDARNSQEWCCHIVQRECASEYFNKGLHELTKHERLVLPKRSSIARAMRKIQNEDGKFLPEEEVQVDREIKRQAMHKNFARNAERVER